MNSPKFEIGDKVVRIIDDFSYELRVGDTATVLGLTDHEHTNVKVDKNLKEFDSYTHKLRKLTKLEQIL